MKKIDVYRFGIKTTVVIAVFVMVFAVFRRRQHLFGALCFVKVSGL